MGAILVADAYKPISLWSSGHKVTLIQINLGSIWYRLIIVGEVHHLDDILSSFFHTFGCAKFASLSHGILKLLISTCFVVSLKNLVNSLYVVNAIIHIFALVHVDFRGEAAFVTLPLEPVLFRFFVPFLVNLGLHVEVLIVVTSDRIIFFLVQHSVVFLHECFGVHGKLCIPLLSKFSPNLLHFGILPFSIGWMKQNINYLDSIIVFIEHLLSTLVGKLIGLRSQSRLEGRVLRHLLVRIVIQGSLLLEAVQPEKIELVLDRDVFALSEVKETRLLVIDTSCFPFSIVVFILYLVCSIPLAADHQKSVLQILG